MRLGWIQTSEQIIKKIVNCGQLDSSGGINPIISAIVHELIKTGDLEGNIKFVRCELKHRCYEMCKSLNKCYNINFVTPKGGYFVWVMLITLML